MFLPVSAKVVDTSSWLLPPERLQSFTAARQAR